MFAIFWGDALPGDLRGGARAKITVGPPFFNRVNAPLGARCSCFLTGVGPLIAWRRASAAQPAAPVRRRRWAWPLALARRCCSARRGAATRSCLTFALGGFVLGDDRAGVRGAACARGAPWRDEPVPAALVSLVRPEPAALRRLHRARRHACSSSGVAASSSVRRRARRRAHPRPVRARRRLRHRVRARDVRAGGRAQRTAGADRLRRRAAGDRDGRTETARTERSYFPSAGHELGPISRFFEGEATSEVALDAGLRRDVWASVAPDIGRLRPRVAEGDEVFADAEATGAPVGPGARRPAGRGAARPRALLHRRPAARDLPPAGVADGHVDLDRGARRLPRRPDRALAFTSHRRPARHRRLRGPRRPRGARPARRWTSS